MIYLPILFRVAFRALVHTWDCTSTNDVTPKDMRPKQNHLKTQQFMEWVNTMQCNAMQCNKIQHNTIQYNKIQYNTIQYNTIQYNTSQYKTLFFIPLQSMIILYLNSSPPGQNGRHFTDDVFKYIFMNKKSCIFIRISLKFVPKGPIANTSALVLVMAWRRTGDKPLPEPMLTQFTDAYMRH